ncbi:hypothetical protein G418_01416 [Rhodococcus qingshengii BKS 20-40]|nr:hypothetical protein G418_01416 [Rhodococcus qingshengii BKS 20-40]
MLVVALESLMDGKRTEVPATIGFEVDSTLLTVRAMDTDSGRGTTSRTASMNCRIPRRGPLAPPFSVDSH